MVYAFFTMEWFPINAIIGIAIIGIIIWIIIASSGKKKGNGGNGGGGNGGSSPSPGNGGSSPGPSPGAPGKSCTSDDDCPKGACARATARDGATLSCCKSGEDDFYDGYYYCTEMPNGSICWSDAMCASGDCKGNWEGLRKGVCS